jgi:D-beta-D-heptose 7-phosphate kinase/D-beta-D-heptose 1-phosphate adenosyltransferase
MIPPGIHSLVDRFADQSILVVGDVMLDHFVFGSVTRISPEAPVPVVEYRRDEYRLGGAANVAHNVQALGAHVRVVGVVGEDEAGARVVADLGIAGADASGLRRDSGRPTTRKLRIVTTRNQQVARVDYEADQELTPETEQALLAAAVERVDGSTAVVISDYLKGVITPGVARGVIEAARRRNIPVLVDPKVPHVDAYRGATFITPNHHEAEAVTRLRIRTVWDAREAARAFRDRIGCEGVLITRGEHGMWLLDRAAPGSVEVQEYDLPAVAREVSDVTGAGDTVVATFAVGLAAGGAALDAARIANHAAGIVVAKFGPAVVAQAELLASLSHQE